MKNVNYLKRQRTARIISVITWIALAAYLKSAGCSPQVEEQEIAHPASLGTLSSAEPTRGDGGNDDAGPDGGDSPEDLSTPTDLIEQTGDEREHILLLGFDRSARLPGRTDSMMIVVADYAKKQLGVISVPRDLWVDIPGWEPGRINKVFRVGNMLHGKGGGKRLIKEVIQAELGIRVDHVAAVDFAGFAKIVDILGGIDVDVECPIRDNFISKKSETGYVELSLDAGRNRMDGDTALLFSRSRHGRTDMDRSRRQQAVLMGLKQKATSLGVLWKLPSLFDEMKKNVATDLDMTAAFRLARVAGSADFGKVHGLVLREPIVQGWRSKEGKSALLLRRAEFDSALAGLFDAPPPGDKAERMCRPTDVALNWRQIAKKRKKKLDQDPPLEAESPGPTQPPSRKPEPSPTN